MNNNIRVGSLFGIPFFINPSWFLVLALGMFWFGEQFAVIPQFNGLISAIFGLITALLLFASVLAHELGHSLMAIARGIRVKSITLFIFGGLALLEKEAQTPWESFLIAIAGPLVSFLLFGFFSLVQIFIPLPLPLFELCLMLALLNLILGIFNLIPGLPLDGGNILKAAIWQITGNPNKGLLYASRVGQVFGGLAVIIGGLAVAGVSQYGSIWTFFIGIFLLQNARRSAQSALLQDKLERYTAKDAVIPNSPIAKQGLNVREFVNNYVIGNEKWRKFLVTDEEGKLVGDIALEDLKTIATSVWTETPLQALVHPVAENMTIAGDRSLLEVAKLIEGENIQQFTVIGENGMVLGLLEKSSIINLLSANG
ncbi:MAG: site-2 protease family protein [Cyanobacteria bacterium SBLK]|nr:site-2 protease family protein [Cyanobacteria bacterium SBLK]